jgi:hypothetical protein
MLLHLPASQVEEDVLSMCCPHVGPRLLWFCYPSIASNCCPPPPCMPSQVEGDVLLSDMGQGVPFRLGTFDGAISISAVQWLCNADKTSHDPRRRLKRFFETLYGCLSRGARAVLQVCIGSYHVLYDVLHICIIVFNCKDHCA